jgi:hypothetical protein
MQRGKPARRTQLMNLDDYTIVSIYGAEYRGTYPTCPLDNSAR